MAWSKAYTISGDIAGGALLENQLRDEINAAISTAVCEGVARVDDDFTVYYDVEPSAGDKTIADTTVLNHVPGESGAEDAGDAVIAITYHMLPRPGRNSAYRVTETSSEDWRAMNTAVFDIDMVDVDGATPNGKLYVSGYMENAASTGEIRIYDVTNATSLGTATVSSETPSTVVIGALTPPASGQIFVEVQIRRATGSGKLYIESADAILYGEVD